MEAPVIWCRQQQQRTLCAELFLEAGEGVVHFYRSWWKRPYHCPASPCGSGDGGNLVVIGNGNDLGHLTVLADGKGLIVGVVIQGVPVVGS